MDALLNAGLLALLTTPLVVLALWTSKTRRWAPAWLFLALLALDDLATVLPRMLDGLQVIGGRWNWEGKLLSLAWAGTLLALGPLSFREAGVTRALRPDALRPALLATAALTTLSFCIGVAFGGGAFDAETLAFQLTMPGLAEEVVYRGVLLALLHRALPEATGRARWWPVGITAAAFGLWHGLSVDEGRVAFDALAASFPLVGGLAYGWLRERTGSVAFPIVAHNLGNTAALLGGLIGG